MGFLTNILSGAVKVAIAPVAVAADAVKVAAGVDPSTTKDLLRSAAKDAEEAVDDLTGEGDGGLL